MKFLRKLFSKKEKKGGRGLLIFREVSEAIGAESVLKDKGYKVKVVAPPPSFRKGCDLSIEFDIMEELAVVRTLKEKGIEPLDVIFISDEAIKPLDICLKKDFGDYVMIKAANMKLTYDKKSLKIVNISGGGCPDVPYLSHEMIGKELFSAPSPKDLGFTVCAYALWRAWEEAKRTCSS